MYENMSKMDIMSSVDIPQELVLDSVYEIEEVLFALQTVSKKIQFYKEMKKNRVEAIDTEISKYESKEDWLKQLILNSMVKFSPNEKTINFPGVGKCVRRIVRGNWEISDEQKLLEFLEDKGLSEEVLDVKTTLNKKKAKSVLDELAKNREEAPGVEKKPDYESLSISYKEAEKAVNETKVQTNIEELDSL